MKKDDLEFVTRLGSKSQIVLRKEIRESLGLKPGSMVRLRKQGKIIEIKILKGDEIMADVEKIAKMVGKKIPKGLTSVDIIRKERE